MIIFLKDDWKWNLTNLGLSFQEQSDIFTSEQTKSFSFPITLKINESIARHLNFVNIDNVYEYESKIYGRLQIDCDFFDAYILINGIIGKKVSLSFYYGIESLPLFDKPLKQLNFPVVEALPNLPSYAKNQLGISWPTATHQFVKVLREDLKTTTNYEKFDYFLNNYVRDESTDTWNYIENSVEIEDGISVNYNRNIMVPMTYLLEILKTGFATAGIELRGDIVNDAFIQKILIVPKQFLEQFAVNEYLNYNFLNYTDQETVNGETINVFRQTHTPTATGEYTLSIKINMSDIVASYFSLTVTQDSESLYSVSSYDTEVNINHTLNINILDGTIFFPITVEMKLRQQPTDVSSYNNFIYQYKEGALNIFPTRYTLADFMPDMKFKELLNKLRQILPLRFIYTDNAVYINYLKNHLQDLTFKNMSHLQQVDPEVVLNENNLFKLSYPDSTEVLVGKNGQIFSDTDYTNTETNDHEIKVLPLKVTQNHGNITAVYPEDEQDLMLILFNGTQFGNNTAVNTISNQSLEINSVYNEYWKLWLKFRTNSEIYRDSFLMHFTEKFNINQAIFKYNKNYLVSSIKKTRETEQSWRVDVEMESL